MIERADVLSDDLRTEVATLAHAAETTDGVYPLNDQVDLDVAADVTGPFRHLLGLTAGKVAGYAHLDLRSPDTTAGHVVVHPDARRHGVGRSLVESLSADASPKPLRIWAHGNVEAAQRLASSDGWTAARDLRKMRLPLTAQIDEPTYPDGVTVRRFRPGVDEDAWVAVNAAAFAHHAEQGRLTADDLRQRESQPWFDPLGFFVAERDGEVVGSHWTKIHPASDDGPAHGEVYVVGVRPDQQGSGLGKALTLTGVRYLRDKGLDVVLYVDGDNEAAVATYDRIGFTVVSVDVMYARP